MFTIEVSGDTLDLKDLFDMGKFNVVVKSGTGPNGAAFKATVAFIGQGERRGKNRPYPGF